MTVSNNVPNLKFFLFMSELLRTDQSFFLISVFFAWQTVKESHKGCFNKILHNCLSQPSIQILGSVFIYKYTRVYHFTVPNLATVQWKIVKKVCVQYLLNNHCGSTQIWGSVCIYMYKSVSFSYLATVHSKFLSRAVYSCY